MTAWLNTIGCRRPELFSVTAAVLLWLIPYCKRNIAAATLFVQVGHHLCPLMWLKFDTTAGTPQYMYDFIDCSLFMDETGGHVCMPHGYVYFYNDNTC